MSVLTLLTQHERLQMSAQMTRVLAILFFAMWLFPHAAHAQDPSASDLLKKIAETYERVPAFSVVAEKTVDLDTDTSGQEYIVPKREQIGASHESHYFQVTLMVLTSSKAKLVLKEGGKEVIVVSDGKVVWTWIPAQRAYTEVTPSGLNIPPSAQPLRIGNNNVSGVDLLREYETLVATRFAGYSVYQPWAKLQPSKTLKVNKGKRACYVVTISIGTEKHKLWVDKKDFTVLKSVDTIVAPEDSRGVALQTTITVTTKQMAMNPSLDASNCAFTPPAQTKKVNSLKLSGISLF